MAIPNFLNGCIWKAVAGGTGAFAVSAAMAPYFTPAQCTNPAVSNGAIYNYFAVNGAEYEIGQGTYTAAGTTLSRTTIFSSTNGGSAVNFSTAPIVHMGCAFANDMWSPSAADKFLYSTGPNATAEGTITAAGRALIDDTDAATQRATLGVVIGTNVEAWSANLDTLAAPGNWKVAYTDGSGNQTALTVGAVGTALCGNGVTAAPTWQTVCLAANNLSDVAAATTARRNLGVYKHGADVASAATTNLDTATGDLVDVTGTTTITAVTLSDGVRRWVRFTGALTLTNGASLVLPTGANITTGAGDYALFVGYAAGVVRCAAYLCNSGAPLTDGNYAKLAGNQNLTGGFTATAYDAGTKSSGTFTPNPTLGTWQKFNNNGAFTLAPQSTGAGDSSSMIIDQTNGASAGTITRSGWTKVTGDNLTTTNGNKFRHYCTVSSAGSHISTQALQ